MKKLLMTSVVISISILNTAAKPQENSVNLPDWQRHGECRVAANRWRQIAKTRWQTTVKCQNYRDQDDQLAIDCAAGMYAVQDNSSLSLIFRDKRQGWSDWKLADGDYMLIMKAFCPNPNESYRESKRTQSNNSFSGNKANWYEDYLKNQNGYTP